MIAQPKTAAPTDSAPNTAERQKAWRDEIHTPAAEYNANVPCTAIEADPKNRDKISPERVAAMAESITAVGLLQPVVLRDLGGGQYPLIAGEHRWRAHLALKLKTIAARIYKDQSDLDAAKKKAVENAQRVDLTPIERAKRFKELAELGASQKEIGILFGGVSQPVVANALRLLELPADVQKRISAGEISEAHGVSLVRFAAWPQVCSKIAASVVGDEMTSKDLNDENLPFAHLLVRTGLAYEIKTCSYSGESYTLPKDFYAAPGFFGSQRDYACYYLKPQDPKQNKWVTLKPVLDEARKAKEKAATKTEESKQSKLSPAEAAKRKKKIADNKQARLESELALEATFAHLRGIKTMEKGIVTAMVAKVLGNGHYASNLKEAATKIGLTLPANLVTCSWYTNVSITKLAALSEVDQLRAAAAAVALFHGTQAIKFAHGVSDELTAVIGSKKAETCRKQAEAKLAALAAAKRAKQGGAK